MPQFVPLIGRADPQFWVQASRHTDSEKTYEFLMRSARLKKRMAVWDNALPPPLGANQKRVDLGHCHQTYDLMGLSAATNGFRHGYHQNSVRRKRNTRRLLAALPSIRLPLQEVVVTHATLTLTKTTIAHFCRHEALSPQIV